MGRWKREQRKVKRLESIWAGTLGEVQEGETSSFDEFCDDRDDEDDDPVFCECGCPCTNLVGQMGGECEDCRDAFHMPMWAKTLNEKLWPNEETMP